MRKANGQFEKGYGFWTGKKRENMIADKNPAWKGEKVGYGPLHRWIIKILGQPNKCEECNATDRIHYQWANISGKYLRELNDWKRLCLKCHKKFDSHLIARGEKAGAAKLKDHQIKEIRKLYKTTEYSFQNIGKKFNVSKKTILDIIHNKTWKHI